MKSVCVFCASSFGNKEDFKTLTKDVGHMLAKLQLRLIYGGGQVGLMGVLADEVLANQGKVTGVIPKILAQKEIIHQHVTEMIQTEDILERKKKMLELSGLFLVLPGGIGTMDEFFEVLVQTQIGSLKKKILLLNWQGHYDNLLKFIRDMEQAGLLHPDSLKGYFVISNLNELETHLKELA